MVNDEDKIVEYLARMFGIIIIGVIVAVILAMCSCTRTVYVPVKEVETVYQNHTDTVHRTDSIIKEKETIVMQLDSSAMAEYGIKINNAEKAWLVREKELESKINKLLEKKADTLIIRDTIPQPYAVEKPISTINKVWIKLGKLFSGVGFFTIFLGLVYLISIKKR